MTTAFFAEKLGMTHVYDDRHRHVPVTVLKVLPQVVSGIRTTEKDGYSAIQIGAVASKKIASAQIKELKKNNIALPISKRQEVIADATDVTIGKEISVNDLSVGDVLSISGTTKGKGFAGTVKRHNFSIGPKTHGSKNMRKPGSIGGGYPQRVVKGIRMAGHMGAVKSTTKGHKVMAINTDNNTVAVSGPVAGPNKGRVFLTKLEK